MSREREGKKTMKNAMIRPIAIERAWHLARLHNHHWAADGRPVAWAYARAIRAVYAAWAAWREADDQEAGALAYQATIVLRDAAEDAWHSCRFGADTVEVIPRTEEEADLIGMLPAGQIGGIYFCLSHVTLTGRLGWTIAPDGVVELTVHRPGNRRVLRATVQVGRRVAIEVLRPADVEMRHAATLAEAIDAAAGGCLHPSVIMEEVYDLLPSRRTADVMAALASREA